MRLKKTFTHLWEGWILMFFLIELPALFNKDEGDTFTAHFREWFAFKKGDEPEVKLGALRRTVGLAFLVWLLAHMTTRMFG